MANQLAWQSGWKVFVICTHLEFKAFWLIPPGNLNVFRHYLCYHLTVQVCCDKGLVAFIFGTAEISLRYVFVVAPPHHRSSLV